MIAAPGSAQGKTAVTAALARHFKNQGKKVQVFKIGPDYLDPMILELASGQTVYNLDLWMMGLSHCRQLLCEAAKNNDVILLESLMGLHDNRPSNAQLARQLGLPITLVINVAKFAQTAAAIVDGMAQYGGGSNISGVIGNCVGSENHHRLLCESMGPNYIGSIRRDERMVLPHRHLGLVPSAEQQGLDSQLDAMAEAIQEYEIGMTLSNVLFSVGEKQSHSKLLKGQIIAIAKDAAFSFIYPANIDLLNALGAEIVFFSPLNNDPLPHCDALWFPGGYPELYADQISQANQTREHVLQHHQSKKPILAECGGMMVMCDFIVGLEGQKIIGFGLFQAHCTMAKRFQSIGLQSVNYGAGELRAHSFHHSILHTDIVLSGKGTKQDGEVSGEPFYIFNGMTLTYLHHYFPSNPAAAAALFLP